MYRRAERLTTKCTQQELNPAACRQTKCPEPGAVGHGLFIFVFFVGLQDLTLQPPSMLDLDEPACVVYHYVKEGKP